MNYCNKHTWSDISIEKFDGEIICYQCILSNPHRKKNSNRTTLSSAFFDTYGGIVRHLFEHTDCKHRVPMNVIKSLVLEMMEGSEISERNAPKDYVFLAKSRRKHPHLAGNVCLSSESVGRTVSEALDGIVDSLGDQALKDLVGERYELKAYELRRAR